MWTIIWECGGEKGVKKCVVNTGSVNAKLPLSWTVFMSWVLIANNDEVRLNQEE